MKKNFPQSELEKELISIFPLGRIPTNVKFMVMRINSPLSPENFKQPIDWLLYEAQRATNAEYLAELLEKQRGKEIQSTKAYQFLNRIIQEYTKDVLNFTRYGQIAG